MQRSLLRLRSLWLVVPPTLMCCLDFGLTLYGQSDAYWSGNYQDVNEMSPSFGRYLAMHPLAFVAAAAVWIVILSSLIALLPEKLGMTLSIGIVLGHMAGAASWLAFRFGSYQSCNVLFLLTAGVIVTAFNMGRSDSGQTLIDWSRTPIPTWIRWLLIATLAILPVWWFLVPQ